MNVPANLFMWIMACLPIIVLLLLMIKFQWGATDAAPVGLAITDMSQELYFIKQILKADRIRVQVRESGTR